MQDKLSQYDLLARLVPGGAMLWTANWIMTTSRSGSIPLVQGGITEAVAYALVAYVAGLFLDAVGRWFIEPFVFSIFGKPSKSFLKDRRGVSDTERKHYRLLAATKLKMLDTALIADNASPETLEFVTRRVMVLFGQSNEKVKSTYVQYTLHRSLSAALVVLLGYSLSLCARGRLDWTVTLVELCGLIVFLLGVNHWGFRMVQAAFELLDADSLGLKVPGEPKGE